MGEGDDQAVIRALDFKPSFHKDFRKLSGESQKRVRQALNDLMRDPRPKGLRIEPQQGMTNPKVYTAHVSRGLKFSYEMDGDKAILRRVSTHDEIDRKA